MLVMMYLFFIVSLLAFLVMAYHLIASQRPGIYPSRIILRQRAGIFAVVAAFSLILGLLLFTLV